MNFPQTSARLVRGFRSLARFRPHTHLSNSPASCQNLSQSSSSSTPEETVVGDISRVPIVKRPPASVRRVGIEEDSDSTNAMIVKTGQWRTFDPMYLRDSCICQRCVDPSSKQKNFQTTDIPENIRAKYAYLRDDQSITISWENDIPGFGDKHLTLLPKRFFDVLGSRDGVMAERFHMTKPKIWNKEFITKNLQYVNYHDYMTTIEGLYRAVVQLHYYGLLLIRDVPESEESVADIANRIGTLRDSFYGRTWDVKSIPEAKNVAYTAQYLGLHMDLLYMANPPGYQFLHCIKNTCEGGTSLFSDTFQAVEQLSETEDETLRGFHIPYHYRNAGEHYWHTHPVISRSSYMRYQYVNYSPPFQATHLNPRADPKDRFFGTVNLRSGLAALRSFADKIESKENLFEYRLQERECVIFNNRRVLHGRREFDSSHGERWLKGAYVDTDVFMSRWRVLREKRKNKEFREKDPQFIHVE